MPRLIVFASMLGCLAFCSCNDAKPDKFDAAPCNPQTCAGCCDEINRCMAGNDETRCGKGGGTCVQCLVDQLCASGRCVARSDKGMSLESGSIRDK